MQITKDRWPCNNVKLQRRPEKKAKSTERRHLELQMRPQRTPRRLRKLQKYQKFSWVLQLDWKDFFCIR